MSGDGSDPEAVGKRDFWQCAGVALIIFAIMSGLGACSLGAGVGNYYANSARADK